MWDIPQQPQIIVRKLWSREFCVRRDLWANIGMTAIHWDARVLHSCHVVAAPPPLTTSPTNPHTPLCLCWGSARDSNCDPGSLNLVLESRFVFSLAALTWDVGCAVHKHWVHSQNDKGRSRENDRVENQVRKSKISLKVACVRHKCHDLTLTVPWHDWSIHRHLLVKTWEKKKFQEVSLFQWKSLAEINVLTLSRDSSLSINYYHNDQ